MRGEDRVRGSVYWHCKVREERNGPRKTQETIKTLIHLMKVAEEWQVRSKGFGSEPAESQTRLQAEMTEAHSRSDLGAALTAVHTEFIISRFGLDTMTDL